MSDRLTEIEQEIRTIDARRKALCAERDALRTSVKKVRPTSHISEMVDRFLSGEELNDIAKRFGRKRWQVANSIAHRIAWTGGSFYSPMEKHPAAEKLRELLSQPGVGCVGALEIYRHGA